MSSRFSAYRLLDSGNFRKLEQAGEYRLIRPALNASWTPSLAAAEWNAADAEFVRDSSGHGTWRTRGKKLPESWHLSWAEFDLKVKPTNFGHLGFFAEQYENWRFFEEVIPTLGREVRTLNLFAYSGIGSMAMARAGARPVHLDASRGMTDWGRENLALNDDVPDTVRWIVDDVNKFCRRELRRTSRYQGIALDPPSFGRGSSNELWKIDDQIVKLLELCRELLDLDKPCFVTLSCHSPGFTPIALERLLDAVFGQGELRSGEMTIPEESGKRLPAGITASWLRRV